MMKHLGFRKTKVHFHIDIKNGKARERHALTKHLALNDDQPDAEYQRELALCRYVRSRRR